MEKLSISQVIVDSLELIDSRIINVFNDKFTVQIENITLNILIEDKNDETAGAEIIKTDKNTFFIKVYNFSKEGLRGVFRPIEIGCIDDIKYFFSLLGFSSNLSFKYKLISFNLFQEVKNAKEN